MESFLSYIVLGLLSVNLIHWLVAGGKFAFIPDKGLLGTLCGIAVMGALILSVAFLLGFFPSQLLMGFVLGYGIVVMSYSIWMRHLKWRSEQGTGGNAF